MHRIALCFGLLAVLLISGCGEEGKKPATQAPPAAPFSPPPPGGTGAPPGGAAR